MSDQIILTVENFKSYKGSKKITLQGFTCIIGPNGCGKSNLVDAICFCLGMNALRAEKLSQVVNNQSDSCKVSLEIKERVFSREFSNGKSTYKHNNKIVKYEEYEIILNSMNIFSKNYNYYISQREINFSTPDIINLIEKMSGSIEFKEEYDKLEEQFKHFNKELTFAHEIKKNTLNDIKLIEQSKRTLKKYDELIEKKNVLEKDLIFQTIKSKLNAINSVKVEKIQEINLIEFNEIKNNTINLQNNLFNEEKKLNLLIEEMKEIKFKMLKEEELIEQSHFKKQEIQFIKEKFNKKIKELEREKALFEKQIKYKTEIFNKLEEQRSKLPLINVNEIKKFKEETTEEFKKLNYLKLQILPNKKIIEKLEENNLKNENKINKLENEISEKESENKLNEERIKNLINEKNTFKLRIEKTFPIFKDLIEEENNLKEQLNILTFKINNENYFNMEKKKNKKIICTIELLKKIFSNVHGRLIDLIKPINDKYEVPLSVLISNFENAVVVENEQTAFSAIEYIKEQKLCKLVFLPLQALKVKKSVTSDFLTFDFKFEKAINFVLKNTLIVEDIFTAKKLIYQEKNQNKIVTINGELFLPNGFIIGGEVENKFKNINFEIKKSSNSLENIKNKISEIQLKKSKYQEVEVILERIKNIEETIILIEDSINQNKSKIESYKLEIIELSNNLENNLIKIKAIKNSNLENEIRDIERIIATKEGMYLKSLRENNITLCDYESLIDNSDIEFNTGTKSSSNCVSQLYKDSNNEISLINEKIYLIDKEITELKNELNNKISSIKPVETNINLGHLFSELKEKIINQEKNKENCRISFEEAKKKFDLIKNKIQLEIEENEELKNKNIANEALIYKLEQEIVDLIHFGLLEEIFKLPFEFKNELNLQIKEYFIKQNNNSENELNLQINKIKEEIDQCIPFLNTESNTNINSILKNYEDLRDQTLSIKSQFEEIKKNRLQLFNQCFSQLNDNLSKTYFLITQGNATLTLENKNSPFNSKVSFQIKPLNKRFRELDDLSGGERAMACLSFVIALKEFKQPPFILFDEVDAHLDKVNVDKLNQYLINNSVICITHNQNVYENAEWLVGVYKSNSGSELLTLKLKD